MDSLVVNSSKAHDVEKLMSPKKNVWFRVSGEELETHIAVQGRFGFRYRSFFSQLSATPLNQK
jgi:hypothetical protein